jgi:solute carrier family 13 (sodium-dependent dicarboxylate transporter), member 2/3/5
MTGVSDDKGDGRSGRLVRKIGLFAGLTIFSLILCLPPPAGLGQSAWAALATLALMVIWWVSEAIPVAATSLIPLVALPLLGVASPQEAAAPYADPIIYMFVGGFILAAAIESTGLHRRIALNVLVRIGSGPQALVAGFMVATALLSMWISNTATALMMTPIALAVCAAAVSDPIERRKLSAACVLGVAYAASIGGLGTPIGSPTNLVGLRWLESQGVGLSFGQWMALGLTIMLLVLPIGWFLLTRVVYQLAAVGSRDNGHQVVQNAHKTLGPMHTSEQRVLAVFLAVALAWVLREPFVSISGLTGLTDMVIAVIGAVLLFLIPSGDRDQPGKALIDWSTAERIPWGIVVLFGGGLSMAAALGDTGAPAWVAAQLGSLGSMPTLLVVCMLVAVTIFLSELSSNVATLTTMLPVLSAIVLATGANPLTVGAAVTFAASFGFMLPIATAPNSIAYGTGMPRQSEMIRTGFVLNLTGIAVIVAVSTVLQ